MAARNIKILQHIHRRSQTAVEAGAIEEEREGISSRLKSRMVSKEEVVDSSTFDQRVVLKTAE